MYGRRTSRSGPAALPWRRGMHRTRGLCPIRRGTPPAASPAGNGRNRGSVPGRRRRGDQRIARHSRPDPARPWCCHSYGRCARCRSRPDARPRQDDHGRVPRGTRGSARQAVGLGLATAVSHTFGVLLLAGLIVFAGAALPADRVYPVLSLVSAVIVVAIGAWLLVGRPRGSLAKVRRRRTRDAGPFRAGAQVPARSGPAVAASRTPGEAHDHDHDSGQRARPRAPPTTTGAAQAPRARPLA